MADNKFNSGSIAHQTARKNMKSGMLSAFRTASGGRIIAPVTSYSSTGSAGGTDWLNTVRTETIAALNILDASANEHLIKASEFTTDYMTTARQIFYRIGDDGWYYKWSDGEWQKIYCFSHDTMCNKLYRQIWMQDAFGFSWDHNTPIEQTDKDCKLIGSDEVRRRVIRKMEQEAYPCEVYAPAVKFDAFPYYNDFTFTFEWIEYVDLNQGFDLDVSVWSGMTFESHHHSDGGSTVVTTSYEISQGTMSVTLFLTTAETFLIHETGNGAILIAYDITSGGSVGGTAFDWIRFYDDPSYGVVMHKKQNGEWATDRSDLWIDPTDLECGIIKAEEERATLWYGPLPGEGTGNKTLRVWGAKVWKLNEQGVKVLVRDLRPVRRIRDGACGLMDVCNFAFYYNQENPVKMPDLPSIGKVPGDPIDRYVDLGTDDDLAGVIALLDKKDLSRRIDGRPSHNGVDKPDYDKWWQMVLLPNLYIGTADVPEGAYKPEKSEIWISDKWLPGMVPWFCNEPEPGKVESAGDWKLMSRYPMEWAFHLWRDWQKGDGWTYQGPVKHASYVISTQTNTDYKNGHFGYFTMLNRPVCTKGACGYPLSGYNDWVDASVDVSTHYRPNGRYVYPSYVSMSATISKYYMRTWWEDTVLAWLHCGYWGTMRSERVMKGLVEMKTENPVRHYIFAGESTPDGSFDAIWPSHSESVLGGANPDPTGIAIDRENPYWYGNTFYNEPWSFMWLEYPKGHSSFMTPGINFDAATIKDSSRATATKVFRNEHNRGSDYIAPDGWLSLPGTEMAVYGAFGSDRITGGPGHESRLGYDNCPESEIWTATTASFTDWMGWFNDSYYEPITATDGTQTSSYYYCSFYYYHVADVTRWGLPMGFDGNSKGRSFFRNSGIGFHSLLFNYYQVMSRANRATYLTTSRDSYSNAMFAHRSTGWSCGDGDRYRSNNWMMSDWIWTSNPYYGDGNTARPGHGLLNVHGDIRKFIREHTLYRKPKGHSALVCGLGSNERAAWAADPDCFGIRWNETMDFSHGVPGLAAADVSVIGSEEAYRKFKKLCEKGGRPCEIRIADVDSSTVAGAYTYTVHPDDIDYLNPGYRDKWMLIGRTVCNRYLGPKNSKFRYLILNKPFDPLNPVYRVTGDFTNRSTLRLVISAKPLEVSGLTVTSANSGVLQDRDISLGATVDFSDIPLFDYSGSVGNGATDKLITCKYISVECVQTASEVTRFSELRLEHLAPSNNSVASPGWNEWQQMIEVPNLQVGLAQDNDTKEDYREVWFCVDPVKTPEGMTPWFIEEDGFGNIVSSGASKLVSRYTARKEPDANVATALPGEWSFEEGKSGSESDSYYGNNEWYTTNTYRYVAPNATSYSVQSVTGSLFRPDTGSKSTLTLYRPRIISCGGSRLMYPLMKSGADVMRVHDGYPSTGIFHGTIANMYIATWWEELVMRYAMTAYFKNLRMNDVMNGGRNRIWGDMYVDPSTNSIGGSFYSGSITGWRDIFETSTSMHRTQGSFYSFREDMFISGMTDASYTANTNGIYYVPSGDFKHTGVFMGLESPLNTISGSFPSGIAVNMLGSPMREFVLGWGNHPMVYDRYKVDPMTTYRMGFRSYGKEEEIDVADIDVSLTGSDLISGSRPADWELRNVYNSGNLYQVRQYTSTAYITLGANTANRIFAIYTTADASVITAKRAIDHVNICEMKNNDASSVAQSIPVASEERFFWNGPNYDIVSYFNKGREVADRMANMNMYGLPLQNEYYADLFHTKYGTATNDVFRMRNWIYPYTGPGWNSYYYGSTTGRLDYTRVNYYSNSPLSPHTDGYSVLYPLGDVYTNDQAERLDDLSSVFSTMFTSEYGRMTAPGYRLTCGIRGDGARGPKSRRYPNLFACSQYPNVMYPGIGNRTGMLWNDQKPDNAWTTNGGGNGLLTVRNLRMRNRPVVNLGATRGQIICIYNNTSGSRGAAQPISNKVRVGDRLVLKVWYRMAPDSAGTPSNLFVRISRDGGDKLAYGITTPTDKNWHRYETAFPAITAEDLAHGKLIFDMGITGAGTVEWYMPYLTKADTLAEVEYDWQPAPEDRYWTGMKNAFPGYKDGSGFARGNSSSWVTSGSGSNVYQEAVYDLPGVTRCWRIKTGTTGDRVQIQNYNINFPVPFPWSDSTTDGVTARTYGDNWYTLGFWVKGTVSKKGIYIIKVQRTPWATLIVWPRSPEQGKSVIYNSYSSRVPVNLTDTIAMSTEVTQPFESYTISDWVRMAVTIYYKPENNGTQATDHTTLIAIGYTGSIDANAANMDIKIAGITWTPGLMDAGVPFVSTDLNPVTQYGTPIYYDA